MVYKQIFKRFLFILATAMMVSVMGHEAYASKKLYRYVDENGVQVITDTIPPEDVVRGYDVIDSRGASIENVPPEMSAAEKQRLQAIREEKERLIAWDEELTTRYSTIEDIEAAKVRHLSNILNNISSLKLTLKNISQTIRHFQAEAAASERQGDEVAKETLSSIERLQSDKKFIEQEIDRQNKRKTEKSNSYDADIARFKLISTRE